MRNFRQQRPSGFTLIELVIVIIIIGILAAVAMPRLTGVSDEATVAKRVAILGMVKSAWGIAYAVKKSAPNGQQIIDQTLDPVCTSTECGGAKIALTVGSTYNSPVELTCSNCMVSTINN